MKTGISAASLYPMETESALLHLSDLGYTLFEIFFNSVYEITPEYCRLLNQLQKDYGFQIKSVHPFTSALESMLLFENYERRTAEGFEFYKRYMEAAKSLGADILVLHGQRIGSGSLSDEAYSERYHKLYLLGQTFGITVAQENVRQFRSSRPEFIQTMRRTLGKECAFVLDVKQALLSGVNSVEMCRIMGEQLVHVHLSDHTEEYTCLLPGEGNSDFLPLQKTLDELSYTGAVITEVYRNAISDDNALCRSRIFTENVFHSKKSPDFA